MPPVVFEAVFVAGVESIAFRRGANGFDDGRAARTIVDNFHVRHLTGFAAGTEGGELIVIFLPQVEIIQTALKNLGIFGGHIGAAQRLRPGDERVDLVVAKHEVA